MFIFWVQILEVGFGLVEFPLSNISIIEMIPKPTLKATTIPRTSIMATNERGWGKPSFDCMSGVNVIESVNTNMQRKIPPRLTSSNVRRPSRSTNQTYTLFIRRLYDSLRNRNQKYEINISTKENFIILIGIEHNSNILKMICNCESWRFLDKVAKHQFL